MNFNPIIEGKRLEAPHVIDEVGDSSLGSSLNPDHRYLSLSGVIIELEDVKSRVFPQLERLKDTYFNSHPNEPL